MLSPTKDKKLNNMSKWTALGLLRREDDKSSIGETEEKSCCRDNDESVDDADGLRCALPIVGVRKRLLVLVTEWHRLL